MPLAAGGMTMKAAYIETTGGPEVIRYGDLPRPTPGAGEVLVRVAAVAVNPIDLYIRAGTAPWATIEQGRHISDILIAGYEAAESGQTIALETAF